MSLKHRLIRHILGGAEAAREQRLEALERLSQHLLDENRQQRVRNRELTQKHIELMRACSDALVARDNAQLTIRNLQEARAADRQADHQLQWIAYVLATAALPDPEGQAVDAAYFFSVGQTAEELTALAERTDHFLNLLSRPAQTSAGEHLHQALAFLSQRVAARTAMQGA